MATNDLLPAVLVNTTGSVQAVMPKQAGNLPTLPDRFAKQAGPDVSIKGAKGSTEVYAVFSVDPHTKRLRVAVVDGEGRLLRMIPPESVSEMIASMGRYKA